MAEEQSLPSTTAAFLQFLHSEPFCRLLSHLTGLDLAENVIRCDMTEEGGGQFCSSTSREYKENDGMSQDESSPSNKKEDVGKHTSGLQNCSRKPPLVTISNSKDPDYQQGPSAGTSTQDDASVQSSCGSNVITSTNNDPPSLTANSPGPAAVHHPAAKIRGELLCFQPGDYTLVSDKDPTIGECALDLLLHFCCDGEF